MVRSRSETLLQTDTWIVQMYARCVALAVRYDLAGCDRGGERNRDLQAVLGAGVRMGENEGGRP